MTWLRRQRAALIALMSSAIAVACVHLWLDVQPVSERHSVSFVAVEAGSAEIAGQELSFRSARWDEFPAPEGMRTLSIRLRASGGPEAELCGDVTLTEVHGSRTWTDADDLVDVPYDEGESYCIAESAPYDIISVFVVPGDVDGPFFLDIAGRDRAVARFRVEP
jgi:hypothetical protein